MSAPSVNIYSSKQVFKSRLVAALAFEQAFRDFGLEYSSRSVQSETAMEMLARSNHTLQTYEFILKIRQRV